jgi:hypothetical protein
MLVSRGELRRIQPLRRRDQQLAQGRPSAASMRSLTISQACRGAAGAGEREHDVSSASVRP